VAPAATTVWPGTAIETDVRATTTAEPVVGPRTPFAEPCPTSVPPEPNAVRVRLSGRDHDDGISSVKVCGSVSCLGVGGTSTSTTCMPSAASTLSCSTPRSGPDTVTVTYVDERHAACPRARTQASTLSSLVTIEERITGDSSPPTRRAAPTGRGDGDDRSHREHGNEAVRDGDPRARPPETHGRRSDFQASGRRSRSALARTGTPTAAPRGFRRGAGGSAAGGAACEIVSPVSIGKRGSMLSRTYRQRSAHGQRRVIATPTKVFTR
jgi:hypothetical protein